MHGNKTMTTTTKQTSHRRITDRARYRLPASTTVDPTAHGSTSARTAADPTMHGRRSSYARSPILITRWKSQASTVANLSTRHRFDRHSNKTRLARWRNNQTQQQNGKNMTVDPTTHGTNRARATADRTTHDGKTKQTRPQRRPLKSQSRSKTVANRPRNRRSKHAQSPTLPPHATAGPNTK